MTDVVQVFVLLSCFAVAFVLSVTAFVLSLKMLKESGNGILKVLCMFLILVVLAVAGIFWAACLI